MSKNIEIITATSEIGAGKRGAGIGPGAVVTELLQKRPDLDSKLKIHRIPDQNDKIDDITDHPYSKKIQYLSNAMASVTKGVEFSLNHGYFPLILSGDHSNAIGAVSGFRNHFDQGNIGVIWVDAHLDLHSPFTTPSGNIHGMALNALLATDNTQRKRNEPDEESLQKWEQLKTLGTKSIMPKVLPENIIFIGVRDYEEEEMELAQELGIHIYTPQNIDDLGIEEVIKQSVQLLDDCNQIYVSFDVDSMDPGISSGTGTPVDGGLRLDEAELIFDSLFHHPKVKAFEITEVNPTLEDNNAMAQAVAHLLGRVL